MWVASTLSVRACCLRVWQRTSASPPSTQPVLSLCQITNYLTVPAHKLDSPTLSRARIGSGKELKKGPQAGQASERQREVSFSPGASFVSRGLGVLTERAA